MTTPCTNLGYFQIFWHHETRHDDTNSAGPWICKDGHLLGSRGWLSRLRPALSRQGRGRKRAGAYPVGSVGIRGSRPSTQRNVTALCDGRELRRHPWLYTLTTTPSGLERGFVKTVPLSGPWGRRSPGGQPTLSATAVAANGLPWGLSRDPWVTSQRET